MKSLINAIMRSDASEATLMHRLRIITILAFVSALAFWGVLGYLAARVYVLEQQKDAEIIAANQSTMLDERLNRAISSTYALAAILREGRGSIEHFDDLARELRRFFGEISSLQLARNGIVTQVSPLRGNEVILGHDLLKDPTRNKEAFTALLKRRLTLAGPMELLQGGKGVIGRLPVYMSDESGKEQFWGFATVVIQMTTLLDASGLRRLDTLGYDYELSRSKDGSDPKDIIERSGDFELNNPVVRTIDVPNGEWYLRIQPRGGWMHPALLPTAGILMLLISTLVTYFIYYAFRQPLILRRLVDRRTQELEQTNHDLTTEIERHEQTQVQLSHINRLFSLLSHANVAIARITDRIELLDELCQIAVTHGGFPMARIALFNEAEQQWQWAHKRGMQVPLPDCEQQLQECTFQQLAEMRHSIIRVCTPSKRCNAEWCTICPNAEMAGFHAHIMVLVKSQGRPAGIFSLFAYEEDYFDDAQLHMLEDLAIDISFALDHIEGERIRCKIEEDLRKLSRAVEQSANAVLITDNNGTIEYVNPWFTRITGYTLAEIAGKTPRVLKSAETPAETHKRMWETILSGKEWTGELHNTKKNGQLYWSLATISPLKNEAGQITHFVAVTEDITERKQTEQTIRHLAFHDPLTGLPNRRLFNDRLNQAVVSRYRKSTPFAILLLDLDRFKTVNDTLGHDVGDALLKAVAARLQSIVREGDTLARMGGDEFAILALQLDKPEDTAHIAEKLLQSLQAPFTLYGHELYVSTSIGITLFPSDGIHAEALIKNADIALYRAKELGRNNFQFFIEDMNAAMAQRLQLETSMRSAIERNEFMLHYQPQVDVVTGRIRGTEALIRWRHPELGLVSPARFIPLAEETGMIVEIGEWTLRTACEQAKEWERAGVPMRVAVNLSARQFHQGNLAETIEDILKSLDLCPSLLEVELTEGILMDDTAHTAAILHRLHSQGIQISIDDFGTGYSSLSYLKRLPITVLKIDQSFVRDIDNDPDDRTIVTAVIALAHSMKLKVVAEGVETEEQLAFLRDYRCDIMQGYLYSKPIPGEDLKQLLLHEQGKTLDS